MTTSTPDLAKLQNLIATATNPRQKAMYEKLLEKAKKQLGLAEDVVPKNLQQPNKELDNILLSSEQSTSASSTVVKIKPQSPPKQRRKNKAKGETNSKSEDCGNNVKSKNKGKSKADSNKSPQSKTGNETEIEAGKETPTTTNKITSVKKAKNLEDKPTKKKKKKSITKSKKIESSASDKSDSARKSKSDKSKSDEQTEPVEKSKIIFFQAIGVIKGLIELVEEQLWITIDEQKYHLGYVPHKKVFYNALVAEIKENGSKIKKVSVYPQLTHDSEKKKIQVKFTLVSVSKSEKDKALFKKLVPGEFQVSGFWQYVPFCDLPCVSIKRNYTKNLAYKVRKMETAQARYFLRSNVIPLAWQEPTVEAFKYNPKLKKKNQMSRYFVQLKVFFTPTENKFTFVEQFSEPLLDAPKYLKAENLEHTPKKSK